MNEDDRDKIKSLFGNAVESAPEEEKDYIINAGGTVFNFTTDIPLMEDDHTLYLKNSDGDEVILNKNNFNYIITTKSESDDGPEMRDMPETVRH